jgi:hypothetical protein
LERFVCVVVVGLLFPVLSVDDDDDGSVVDEEDEDGIV